MANKKKKEPKEIPSRSGRAGKSKKQPKESKQTKPIKMADGEKIPKGVDKVILSKDAAGESHVIMTISNIGTGSKKSLKDKAPSTKKTADKPASKVTPAQLKKAPEKPVAKRSEPKPAMLKNEQPKLLTPFQRNMKIEEDAAKKLEAAGYVLNGGPTGKKAIFKMKKVAGADYADPNVRAHLSQPVGSYNSWAEAAEALGLNKPQKTVQKPAGKRSEPKSAAPKKEPKAAKKAASVKKNAVDKLLKHSDKDEMNVAGGKPIIINGANGKPKKAPKVLRRVAKTGGYTVWDEIKRNGKTFATEREAKDYAADLLKKTGKLALITPTDRQVTHTFKPEEEKKKK